MKFLNLAMIAPALDCWKNENREVMKTTQASTMDRYRF
jgi:hypothetical protein